MQMVFGTPKTYYDADQAAMILRDLGEDLVAVTRVNLLARGVLSRQIKLGKHGPGRTLKIAEAYGFLICIAINATDISIFSGTKICLAGLSESKFSMMR